MRVRKNPSSYKKQEKERLKKKQNAHNDLMLEWLAEDEPRAEAGNKVGRTNARLEVCSM